MLNRARAGRAPAAAARIDGQEPRAHALAHAG